MHKPQLLDSAVRTPRTGEVQTNMRTEEFEAMIDRLLSELPPWVASLMDNVLVVAMDSPPPEEPQEGDREALLGEYVGVSLPDRAADYWGVLPDEIRLYRLAHLELGLSRAETEEEIRRTLLHELGHYLGFSERRLHQLGWD